MANRFFTVETRGESVVILGGPSALTSSLIQEFLSKGIFAAKISTPKELEELRLTHDPDYLMIFESKILDELINPLQSLIQSGESRLVVVHHLGSQKINIPLTPVAKHLYYSDYVGESELVSPTLEHWIEDVQKFQKLIVPGDGLEELSLLGQHDLARLLVVSSLSPNPELGAELYLGNPEPISLLNLAYLIRTNLSFKVALTFDTESPANLWSVNPESLGKTLAKLGYDLSDNLGEILQKYLTTHVKDILPKAPIVQEESPIAKKIESTPAVKKLTPLKINQPIFVPLQPRKFKQPLTFKRPIRPVQTGPLRLSQIIGRGLVIAVALYFGTLAFSATVVGLSLNHMFTVIRAGELPQTNKFNNFAITYLQANWIALTGVPGLAKRQSIGDINLLLDAYSQALSAFTTAESLNKSTGELTNYIFGSGNADVAQVVSLSRLQAEELYQKLSLLDGSLPTVSPTIIKDKYQSRYQEIKLELTKLKRSVTTSKALLAITPDVIGLGGRKKYAVLFQNNMELRPTGGFISSFAILSFENGKLYDMPIFDVYESDGQLKGHVDPPKPIKDILGESNWYLRDSNFDPDFPTSARRAEWFIKKSMNLDLDGTIALNINTLSSILQAIGPLEVSDYNETITENNIFERSQFHAEGNFVPGSTQKKEFLSTVGNGIFNRLPTLGEGEGIKLIGALSQSIQEKNTLISLVSPNSDRIFKTLGWNGELSDLPCPTSGNCHKDFLMVVDSNFGVNKANYYIKRKIEEVITFDTNLTVNHVLRLSYQNTSISSAWPAGIYKNYQRLYLPVGSTIIQVKVGERVLESKDYTIVGEHGKLVLAYLAPVPINETVIVEIEYATPQLPQENELLYTWYWQKQPGTSSEDSISVYVNYPNYLTPIVISPQSELHNQQLKFDMKNDSDHRVTIKFAK